MIKALNVSRQAQIVPEISFKKLIFKLMWENCLCCIVLKIPVLFHKNLMVTSLKITRQITRENFHWVPLGAIGCREEILNITTCTILQRKKLQVTHWICIKYTYYTMCWMRFGMTMFCREWASQWEKILWLGKIVTWTICYTNWQILRTWSPAKIFPWTSVGSLCVTKPQQRERFVLTMNPYVILFVYYYNLLQGTW